MRTKSNCSHRGLWKVCVRERERKSKWDNTPAWALKWKCAGPVEREELGDICLSINESEWMDWWVGGRTDECRWMMADGSIMGKDVQEETGERKKRLLKQEEGTENIKNEAKRMWENMKTPKRTWASTQRIATLMKTRVLRLCELFWFKPHHPAASRTNYKKRAMIESVPAQHGHLLKTLIMKSVFGPLKGFHSTSRVWSPQFSAASPEEQKRTSCFPGFHSSSLAAIVSNETDLHADSSKYVPEFLLLH